MDMEQRLLACPVSQWKTQQIIALDWYDGPREGFCAFDIPECEFYFELVAERYNPNGGDDRLVRLRELPKGTVAIIESLYAMHESSAVDELLLKTGRQTNILIWNRFMNEILGCWLIEDVPPNHQELFDYRGTNGRDWFAHLGI